MRHVHVVVTGRAPVFTCHLPLHCARQSHREAGPEAARECAGAATPTSLYLPAHVYVMPSCLFLGLWEVEPAECAGWRRPLAAKATQCKVRRSVRITRRLAQCRPFMLAVARRYLCTILCRKVAYKQVVCFCALGCDCVVPGLCPTCGCRARQSMTGWEL